MCGIAVSDIGEMVHGTTLVTNAVIERKGCRLGLITTAGFRDVLEMGREQRYDIYDLFLRFPNHCEPRSPAGGRGAHRRRRAGRDGAGSRRRRGRGAASGRRRMRGDRHRLPPRLRQSCARAAGRCGGGRAQRQASAVSISSAVVGEIGEYPRTVTTCANAYVQPLVDRYLGRLEAALSARGFTGSASAHAFGRSLVSVEAARAYPIRLLESGPAGGGLATALFGEMAA